MVEGQPAEAAKEFRTTLAGQVAKAVKEAEANLQPVEASAGVGREPSICFNRRYIMKDGTIGWNPGKMNPNIVRPAGPADPDVPVVHFQSPAHQPVATFVNYAIHPDTTGGTEYSADFPHTLAKLLAPAEAPEMLTLFAIGAAGNINYIDEA